MAKRQSQKRRDVPDDHHVARYCNPQRIIIDPETQAILGVYPEAFELRTKEKETYLSAFWMESFGIGINLEAQYLAVVAALRKKHKNMKPQGAFASS